MTSTVNSSQQNGSHQGQGDGQSIQPSLIINYIPQMMSEVDVKSLFSTVGEIQNCKLMIDRTTGNSLGYAFITYYKREHADKAITTLSGLQLHNKILRVSYARPSSEEIKGNIVQHIVVLLFLLNFSIIYFCYKNGDFN